MSGQLRKPSAIILLAAICWLYVQLPATNGIKCWSCEHHPPGKCIHGKTTPELMDCEWNEQHCYAKFLSGFTCDWRGCGYGKVEEEYCEKIHTKGQTTDGKEICREDVKCVCKTPECNGLTEKEMLAKYERNSTSKPECNYEEYQKQVRKEREEYYEKQTKNIFGNLFG